MTEHIDRDDLRDAAEGHLRYGGGGDDLANGVLALLDALDRQEKITTALRAEARVMRGRISDLAQEARDEREAALDALAQLKLRDERIKAVEDVLDQEAPEPTIATRVRSDTIRRALDGDFTNRK